MLHSNMKATTINLNKEILEKFDTVCVKLRVTRSWLMRELIIEAITKHSKLSEDKDG